MRCEESQLRAGQQCKQQRTRQQPAAAQPAAPIGGSSRTGGALPRARQSANHSALNQKRAAVLRPDVSVAVLHVENQRQHGHSKETKHRHKAGCAGLALHAAHHKPYCAGNGEQRLNGLHPAHAPAAQQRGHGGGGVLQAAVAAHFNAARQGRKVGILKQRVRPRQQQRACQRSAHSRLHQQAAAPPRELQPRQHQQRRRQWRQQHRCGMALQCEAEQRQMRNPRPRAVFAITQQPGQAKRQHKRQPDHNVQDLARDVHRLRMHSEEQRCHEPGRHAKVAPAQQVHKCHGNNVEHAAVEAREARIGIECVGQRVKINTERRVEGANGHGRPAQIERITAHNCERFHGDCGAVNAQGLGANIKPAQPGGQQQYAGCKQQPLQARHAHNSFRLANNFSASACSP